MVDEFKKKVMEKHGDVFDEEKIDMALKSGTKLPYDWLLTRQMERVGIAKGIGDIEHWIMNVDHLEDMLSDDFDKKYNDRVSEADKKHEIMRQKFVVANRGNTQVRSQTAESDSYSIKKIKLTRERFRALISLMKRQHYITMREGVL